MMFGLPDTVLHLLQNYFSSHPEITKVVIYGSRALGREQPGSDVDLAIFTTVEKDISASVALDLDELKTPYTFDVLDYKSITHGPLKEHIDRVGINLLR